ncbi:MAG: type IV pilus biogenesis/stability protein PilW [Gammaproteobacteria bacterium]
MNPWPWRIVIALSLAALGGCASNRTGPAVLPDHEVAMLNLKLGMGYMQSGRFDIAQEKLKKALQLDGTIAEAHNALGVLYEEIHEPRLAESAYQQALAQNSNYSLARMNYGRLLCAIGKTAEGEQQFVTALQSTDTSPETAYTGAGVCARLRNDSAQAATYFRKAVEANPYATAPLLELANLSYAQRQYQEARQYLQRYHQQTDYSPASLDLAIRIEQALGDKQARDNYVRLLLSKFADSSEAQRLAKSK